MDVRATLLLRNDAMLAARKDRGLSQAALAELCNVQLQAVAALEKFDYSNPNVYGEARAVAIELQLPVETVCPDGAAGHKTAARVARVVQVDDVRQLTSIRHEDRFVLPDPADVVCSDGADAREKLLRSMQKLTTRERVVVALLGGIACGDNPDGATYTLEEVGRVFKVTRERIRQISDKAKRKLEADRDLWGEEELKKESRRNRAAAARAAASQAILDAAMLPARGWDMQGNQK